ncbi:SdpI family protein [Rossellomorea aquimaris]|uniref:SdpI family protein n=2 Tax=Bacillaceae TaxID=186817 RepID=A0A5D4U6W4_9BACI|nr:SdpI family protein [Rossellomorea aquimaris]
MPQYPGKNPALGIFPKVTIYKITALHNEVRNMNVGLGLTLFTVALLCIGLSIPLYLGKVEMNYLYGVRFPKSFQSEEAWYKINKYGGLMLIIWSIPELLLGIAVLFLPPVKETVSVIIAFSPVLFLLPPLIQSYIYSEKVTE